MMQAIGVIARLTLTRLIRGRAIWLTLFLALAPILTALQSLLYDNPDPKSGWLLTAEIGLRFLVPLAAAIHLAGAVGDEVDGKTITYLWSRPMSRMALLLGKMAAIVPFVAIVAVLSFAFAYLIVAYSDLSGYVSYLLRMSAAVLLGTFAASCFAVGAGTLFSKHPFIFTLGYLLSAEQILTMIPNVAYLSIVAQMRAIADVPGNGEALSLPAALIALFVQSGIWLVIGFWRVNAAEYVAVDR